MKKRIWLDCDGVLLDWTRPFLVFSGLATRGVKYEDIFDIDLTKLYKTPEDFYEVMHKYHQSDTFSNLPALISQGAIEMLKNFGYELHVITQIENNPISRMNRMGNLTHRFGAVFTGVHFTERGQSKLDYILNMYPGDKAIVIEDHPTFLKEASDYIETKLIRYGWSELLAYGVKHPYNEDALKDIKYIVKVPDTTSAIMNILNSAVQGQSEGVA